MMGEFYTVTIYMIGVSHTFEGGVGGTRNPYLGNCL